MTLVLATSKGFVTAAATPPKNKTNKTNFTRTPSLLLLSSLFVFQLGQVGVSLQLISHSGSSSLLLVAAFSEKSITFNFISSTLIYIFIICKFILIYF